MSTNIKLKVVLDSPSEEDFSAPDRPGSRPTGGPKDDSSWGCSRALPDKCLGTGGGRGRASGPGPRVGGGTPDSTRSPRGSCRRPRRSHGSTQTSTATGGTLNGVRVLVTLGRHERDHRHHDSRDTHDHLIAPEVPFRESAPVLSTVTGRVGPESPRFPLVTGPAPAGGTDDWRDGWRCGSEDGTGRDTQTWSALRSRTLLSGPIYRQGGGRRGGPTLLERSVEVSCGVPVPLGRRLGTGGPRKS